jgi:PDZ domain-containing protein
MDPTPPTTVADADSPGGDWDMVPPELRPRPKLPKWPFVLAGVLIALVLAVVAAWPIQLPYFATSPGPVSDTSDYITIENSYDDEGELLFLTIVYSDVNVIEYVGAWLDPEVDLVAKERIQPAGVSREDLRRQNLAMMANSQQTAVFVALTKLGYEVTFEGSGAVVTSVVDDSAAVGVLQPGDAIVAVDGSEVEFVNDTVDAIGGRKPGDTITLTVQRPVGEEDGEFETLDFDITLGPFRVVNEDGSVEEDPDRGMVGVLLDNGPSEVIFPVDVEIDADNIGGPSAGMMFTLEIINQLTEDDLTKGHRVAGTGTIDPEGMVGAIGSVRQKVFGAISAGAEYILVPAANYDVAVDAAGDDIDVVRVATIDDALDFFERL